MAAISKSIEIDVPVKTIFDYVTNPRNTISYSPNFSRFDPITPNPIGLGARVEAAGNFRGVPMKTILEVTEFVPNSRFVSRSKDGIKSVTIWEFKPINADRTEVIFTSDYSVPGLGLGKIIDKLIVEKDVEKTTIETLVNLKKVMEGKPNLRVVAAS